MLSNIKYNEPDLVEPYNAKIEEDKLKSLTFEVVFDTGFYKTITKDNHNWVDNYYLETEFLKEQPDDLNSIFKATAFGAAVGFCIATGYFLVISVVKIAIWATWKTSHVIGTIFFGTLVGAAAVGSARYVYFKITKAQEFETWKINAIKNHVYEKFSKCIENDEYLKGRVCPITLSLIVNPYVVETCGHIFEHTFLLKHLEKQQNDKLEENCPICRKKIQKINLKYAENYHVEVCQRIVKILEFVLDNDIREGMKKYVQVQIKEQTEILQNRLNVLINLNKIDQINIITYQEERKKILDVMNVWDSWKEAVSKVD